MKQTPSSEHHHGVFVAIDGKGVFIIGEAGSGKSSLALELLHQGHQLIADDSIEFKKSETITGHCPQLLHHMLHTRELGLINITEQFGNQAWQAKHTLDHIIRLQSDHHPEQNGLAPTLGSYLICQQELPVLNLNLNNPASLTHRIKTWISSQDSTVKNHHSFKQKQQNMMTEPHTMTQRSPS